MNIRPKVAFYDQETKQKATFKNAREDTHSSDDLSARIREEQAEERRARRDHSKNCKRFINKGLILHEVNPQGPLRQ